MALPRHGFRKARSGWPLCLPLLAALAFAPSGAQAQDRMPRLHAGDIPGGWLSELRFGAMAHDPGFLGGKERGADLNAELLFTTPVPQSWVEGISPRIRWLLQPRPHMGFLLNTSGDTSAGYVGLTFTTALAYDVFRPGDAIRFDLFGGGSVNDGLRFSRVPDRKALGSNTLFRVGGEIGYQITPRYSVALYLDHMSNGGLAHRNQGYNTLGLRFGVGF